MIPAKTVEWRADGLWLLDQTLLPSELVYQHQTSAEILWQSIARLCVRGAPAIGVAAGYGLVVAMRDHAQAPPAQFRTALATAVEYLASSRPTAVNLRWALQRVAAAVSQHPDADSSAQIEAMLAEAKRIHSEDAALCQAMGEHGAALIKPGMGVLTHCNAGALATAGIGTATAPMYMAHQRGVPFRVFADETRPLQQGARLTAWELNKAGIDVSLIIDSAAASMMASGAIDLVIVGTDRVAANGDVANKIGTLSVAIVAKHFGIPFYVACPISTVDQDTPNGAAIPIEQRAGNEILDAEFKVLNPAFDITPCELVTGFITERGVLNADRLVAF